MLVKSMNSSMFGLHSDAHQDVPSKICIKWSRSTCWFHSAEMAIDASFGRMVVTTGHLNAVKWTILMDKVQDKVHEFQRTQKSPLLSHQLKSEPTWWSWFTNLKTCHDFITPMMSTILTRAMIIYCNHPKNDYTHDQAPNIEINRSIWLLCFNLLQLQCAKGSWLEHTIRWCSTYFDEPSNSWVKCGMPIEPHNITADDWWLKDHGLSIQPRKLFMRLSQFFSLVCQSLWWSCAFSTGCFTIITGFDQENCRKFNFVITLTKITNQKTYWNEKTKHPQLPNKQPWKMTMIFNIFTLAK